eukprot:CAMPEP_0117872960 /NCGR_PEP_ID=MMETSP0950-20121206/11410_1 /TAXON_ID=44440 /ORGANISM="Chattonella subsalsa, Strain CCMP2191" /LENGTH=696 /DNA_ID=CAMNT_0005725865 /DNA_START=34 /DNA_END=2124 /DNA_ORIENTATION=+
MASNRQMLGFRPNEKSGERIHLNEAIDSKPAVQMTPQMPNAPGLSPTAFMEPVDDAFLDSLEGHWGELEAIHETVSNTVASLYPGGTITSHQRTNNGTLPQNIYSHVPQNANNPQIFGNQTTPQLFGSQMSIPKMPQGGPSVPRDVVCNENPNQAENTGRKRKRNGPMTQEERAKQNRDRNREHARNTRLRKKAFVDELKKQVQDLAAAREREERERHLESQRSAAAMNEIRYQVLETFLDFRGRGETDISLWSSILDEAFTMRMPLTPYRSYPQSQVAEGSRKLKGVEDIISDIASLQAMLDNLGKGTEQWKKSLQNPNAPKILMEYQIEQKDLLVQADRIMANWTMKTKNAVSKGARAELELYGMLRCSFTKFNKLLVVELIFDVYSMLEQLKKCSGAANVPQIPNTLQQVVPAAQEPVLLRTLVDDLCSRRVTSAIINYSDQNVPTKSYLRVYPLSNEGDNVTHFIGVLEKIHAADENDENNTEGEGASSDRTSSSAQSSQYRSTPPEGPDQEDSWGEESSDKQESTSSGSEENDDNGHQLAPAHEPPKSHRAGGSSNSSDTTSEAGSSSSHNNSSSRPSNSSSPSLGSYRGGNSGSDASASSYGQNNSSDTFSDRNASGSEDGSTEGMGDVNSMVASEGSEDGNEGIADDGNIEVPAQVPTLQQPSQLPPPTEEASVQPSKSRRKSKREQQK